MLGMFAATAPASRPTSAAFREPFCTSSACTEFGPSSEPVTAFATISPA
jgi:hypothetical protein